MYFKGIKNASDNYKWVSGRGLSKTCACFANNYVMVLKEESCNKTSPIRDRDVKNILMLNNSLGTFWAL